MRFQSLHTPSERGLGDAEAFRRAREIPRLADGEEVLEFPIQQRHAQKSSEVFFWHWSTSGDPAQSRPVRSSGPPWPERRRSGVSVLRVRGKDPLPDATRRALDDGMGTLIIAPRRWSGRYAFRLGAALAMACTIALAQHARAQGTPGNDELAAQATDPTASLMSFQLNDWYTANFHGIDDSLNQVVFRAAIPFALGDTRHIFRVTQPYVTSSPSGATGFADTTIFDLVVFNQPWGRWGVGISGTLPTGQDGLTADQWTAGPALGFVNSSTKQYNWGLFAQSFFSFAGEERRARDRPGQPPAHLQLSARRRPLAVARQQRVRLRHRQLALGVAQSRPELRAGRDLRRPQVAPEHRGRLRLPGRLRQSEVDDPGEHRAAVAHPLR